mmetsp:Transcript_17165/g.65042  ORF Transcript_17165/g.65042 Transcript_17165/m.65042 type:complete len:284 (-) Transcript_17165:2896-3747(-)
MISWVWFALVWAEKFRTMGAKPSGMRSNSLARICTDLPVPVSPTASTWWWWVMRSSMIHSFRTVSSVGTMMELKLAPSGTANVGTPAIQSRQAALSVETTKSNTVLSPPEGTADTDLRGVPSFTGSCSHRPARRSTSWAGERSSCPAMGLASSAGSTQSNSRTSPSPARMAWPPSTRCASYSGFFTRKSSNTGWPSASPPSRARKKTSNCLRPLESVTLPMHHVADMMKRASTTLEWSLAAGTESGSLDLKGASSRASSMFTMEATSSMLVTGVSCLGPFWMK